jgi:hypothetical protein
VNVNILDAWYNGINNTICAANCANISWTLRKTLPIFQMQVCASFFFH